MRLGLFVLLVLTSAARADVLDVKATVAKVAACAPEADLAALGAIEKAETIGKRPATSVLQLTGKKARGYVVFGGDTCFVIPVTGKPWAFARGNFGNGATAAYALRGGPSCGDVCTSVVSLKSKDDQLLDLLVLPEDCEDRMTMTKRAVFAGRDSIELGCFTSRGADQGRSDHVLDAGDGSLRVMLSVAAGIAWHQIPEDENSPLCTARVPGGIKVVTAGAKPAIDVTTPATPEEADAAKVERHSGGCEATVTTRRHALDASGKKLVPVAGKPRVWIAKKLCKCRRP